MVGGFTVETLVATLLSAMVPLRPSAPTLESQSRYVIPFGKEVSMAKLPVPFAVDVPSQLATFLKSAGPSLNHV